MAFTVGNKSNTHWHSPIFEDYVYGQHYIVVDTTKHGQGHKKYPDFLWLQKNEKKKQKK